MSMPKPLVVAVVVSWALAVPVQAVRAAETPHLGKPADPELLRAWDISIPPDGSGLPPGRGSVAEGAGIYESKCVMCHGTAGAGQPADRLTGGIGTLASAQPVKTVASYWPYATTLFDYVRRAMPINAPRSLTANEVYALCAYLLSVDGIVPRNSALDGKSLPKVKMPNRNGFINVWNSSGGARR
jgi:S-disulfanyl-L-cysteine oxidoreductase SoxD